MKNISKEDILLKYKEKDEFIYSQLQNILTSQPFNTILEYENGDIYIGTSKNKKRNGFGYYLYVNMNTIYQGQWNNNTKNGYGTLYNQKEVIYSGEWLNNIPHGFGCNQKDGQLYMGCYKYGFMNGVGILRKKRSLNFCLFEWNKKKCMIRIFKYMDIYLYIYNNDEQILYKEKMDDIFPFYIDKNLCRNIHEQVFDKLFGMSDELTSHLFQSMNKKNNKIKECVNSQGILQYINYDDHLNFLKDIINKTDILNLRIDDNKINDNKINDNNNNKNNIYDDNNNNNNIYDDNNNNKNNIYDDNNNNNIYDDGNNNYEFHFFDKSSKNKSNINKVENDKKKTQSDSSSSYNETNKFTYMSYSKERLYPYDITKSKRLFNDMFLFYHTDSCMSDFCIQRGDESESNMNKHEIKKMKKMKNKIKIEFPTNVVQDGIIKEDNCDIYEKYKKCDINQKTQNDIFHFEMYEQLAHSHIKRKKKKKEEYYKLFISNCNINVSDSNNLQLINHKTENNNNNNNNNNNVRINNGIYSKDYLFFYENLFIYLKELNKKKKIENIYQWEKDHILILLYLFKLNRYIKSFSSNKIKGLHFFFILNTKVLKELGISNKEHIFFLMNIINTFNNIHNIYLKVLKKDMLIYNDYKSSYAQHSINKKEVFIIKKFDKSIPPNHFLCYYKNSRVYLKGFTQKKNIYIYKSSEKKEKNILLNINGTCEKRIEKKSDENMQHINDEGKNEVADHNADINISIKIQNNKDDKYDKNNNDYNKNNNTDEKKTFPNFKNNLFNAAHRLLYNESINETLFNNLKNIKKNLLKLEEQQDEYTNDEKNLGDYENMTNKSLSYHDKNIIENNKIYPPHNKTKGQINNNNNNMIINTKEYKKKKKKYIYIHNNPTNYKKTYNNKKNNIIDKSIKKIEYIKEYLIVSNLRHPSILQCIGNIFIDNMEECGIVFEYIKGQTLYDFIYKKGYNKNDINDKINNNQHDNNNIDNNNNNSDNNSDNNNNNNINSMNHIHNNTFRFKEIVKLLFEISSCLYYIHKKNICHGNINSKNIMITKKGDIKIYNFECSFIESFYDYKMKKNKEPNRKNKNDYDIYNNISLNEKMFLPFPYFTTINNIKNNNISNLLSFSNNHLYYYYINKKNDEYYYIAPEVLRQEEYTKKSDIYSFGVIMYEIIFEKIPFKNDPSPFFFSIQTCYHPRYINIDRVKLNFICENNIFSSLYHSLFMNIIFLIKQCLHPFPTTRPTAKYLSDQFEQMLEIINCYKIK
ncbi:protein kinase, putative [Plasmodium sp. gorilla clade G2]|uniref:protein kinase, putative n=1 Tax=Plasmodium sp. gorilla clade G2 TaxID=880535 RepID=UPI000D2129BD|nr:protein kinase, putative [Plasmodium sp. gorilla clade G2]SOV14410.1 protein kinase, putative [Plasmodium sp. gorilla clade G2]